MYKTERSLVRQFVRQLRTASCPWGPVEVSREFDYRRGRADVVVAAEDGEHLIAFEAKLEKWRDALHQAYRNTCFAHSSYVILPRRVALRAQRYSADFSYRNVGLCYIDSGRIAIVLTPEKKAPLEPGLMYEALAAANSRSDSAHGRARTRSAQNLRQTRHAIRRARGRRNV